MRHKYKKTQNLNTGVQKTTIVIRNMLTNLVTNGKMQTTPAKARVLKSEADKFFSRLLRIHARFESAADAKRESIRYVKSMLFTENAGKKALDEWLPKFQEEGVST